MKCTIVSGNTSLCVAKLWTLRTHIHLPKYLRLSRTPSQWYGARDSSSGTSPTHPRNSNNLCPLSLGFNFPSGPIATSLVAGASTLQCRSSLVLIFSVASWRSITRARYHSSPSFADNFHRWVPFAACQVAGIVIENIVVLCSGMASCYPFLLRRVWLATCIVDTLILLTLDSVTILVFVMQQQSTNP